MPKSSRSAPFHSLKSIYAPKHSPHNLNHLNFAIGLAGLHPATRAAQEWVDFGLVASLQLLGNHLLDYGDRPWEWEADLLSAPRTPAARFEGW